MQQPAPFPCSIRKNIELPLREHGMRRPHERQQRCQEVLRAVGFWSEVHDRLDASALTLSGGQQQRLCFARALALRPEVLLLDEPCSALDPMASAVVEELIHELGRRHCVLLVTHNLAQARRLAQHVVVCWMEECCGCVVEQGAASRIFEAPQHATTQAYLAGRAG